MPNDLGTFRVDMEVENPAKPGVKRTLRSVLVDTGAELSWVPADVLEALGVERNNQWRFRQANGTVLERWTGIVVITVAGKRTGDDVVFGEPGDLTLLGSRTLEGLNFRVEPVTKQLVDAGPAPAAVLVSCLLLFFCTFLHAQTPADTLRQLDSAWARSYATNDTALAARLFDDSLIVTGGNGRLKGKKGELADVGPSPGFQIHYFRTSDVNARPYGSAGVVIGLAEWSWTYNGKTTLTRRRYTAVYARGGPLGWRMVSLHIGPAPEP